MTNPEWLRLVSDYQRALMRLFRGRLLDLMAHPEIADNVRFREATDGIAYRMAAQVAKANVGTWRGAMMRLTNSREMHRLIQSEIANGGYGPELEALARRNAHLIRSLPQEISRMATQRATKMVAESGRAGEMERFLRSLVPDVAKSRIKLIARTEVSRANTDLTQARSERLGIEWYQWATSEDQRVRPSHRNMDNVLVRWSDPASPEALIGEKSTLGHYTPGSCPQCRCLPLPLASIDEVRWPARMYMNGSIRRTSRAEFTRLIGIQIAA
jgi:SPP1 gp7 family putative phage head morphogenesis protein